MRQLDHNWIHRRQAVVLCTGYWLIHSSPAQ